MNPELESKLRELVACLLETNAQFNLTAIRNPDDAWVKHILDSLQGLETGVFEEQKTAIDVGAGPGFPGLPLAIACPQVKWSFLEATRKKCGFIESMSQRFDLKAQVINARAEDTGQNPHFRQKYDIATARAVGSFMEVAELCLPLVKVNGYVVLWRGKDAEQEAQNSEVALEELGGWLDNVIRYELPGHDLDYHLVVIRKDAATPKRFPRRVGLPKSAPLGS